MRVPKASFRYVSAAALVGIVIFLGAASADDIAPETEEALDSYPDADHGLRAASAPASIATKTAEALDSYPDGGHGLEVAIYEILDSYRGKPDAIARGFLKAAAAANEEQMVAIGRAMAAYARALAEIDPAGSGSVAAAVINVRNPALQRAFKSARGRRQPGLDIPSGNNGGGLEKRSPT